MNILYVDLTSMNISEAVSLYEQLSYKVDAVIKEKENGTNT